MYFSCPHFLYKWNFTVVLLEAVKLHWLQWDTEISSYNISTFKAKRPFKKRPEVWQKQSLGSSGPIHRLVYRPWTCVLLPQAAWGTKPHFPQKISESLGNPTVESVFQDFLRPQKLVLLCQAHLHMQFPSLHLEMLTMNSDIVKDTRLDSQSLKHSLAQGKA